MLPKKILLCTDFSENSLKARLLAISYAKAFNSELVILHVINDRLLGYPSLSDRVPIEISAVTKTIEEGVTQELELLTNDAGRDIVNVSGYSRTGPPAEEIVAFAEENLVDLIIMGTHGWTGVRHLILGSTAENVVRSAKCPVLVVRSNDR